MLTGDGADADRILRVEQGDRGHVLYAPIGRVRVATPQGSWTLSARQAAWIPPWLAFEIAIAPAARLATVRVDQSKLGSLPRTCALVGVSPLLREAILRLAAGRDDLASHHAACVEAVLVVELELELSATDSSRVPLPAHPGLRALCLAFLTELDSPTSPAEWAARLGMSRRTLARCFRHELSTTIAAWQRSVRVEEARRRLRAGESVTQVALDMGYESLSAFTAMFRRMTGLPPSAFHAGSDRRSNGSRRANRSQSGSTSS
jgi:AraC-like DNA-binding protein